MPTLHRGSARAPDEMREDRREHIAERARRTDHRDEDNDTVL
ncbi:hypothetical protein [Nocardia caishijiensis]|nr:hypothetical protein [Nocardia caishijiensis]